MQSTKCVHEALWVPKVKVIHWFWSKSLRFNIFKLLFLNYHWFWYILSTQVSDTGPIILWFCSLDTKGRMLFYMARIVPNILAHYRASFISLLLQTADFSFTIISKIFFIISFSAHEFRNKNEPRHDKTNIMAVHPAKTQISLGICPDWSESSLCTQG